MADKMEELKKLVQNLESIKICSEITDQIADECIGSVDVFTKNFPDSAPIRDRLIVASAVKFTYQIVLDSLRSGTDDEDEDDDECDGKCDECEKKCKEGETPSSAADVLRALLK